MRPNKQHPQLKGNQVHFGSQFALVSVRSQLVLRQSGTEGQGDRELCTAWWEGSRKGSREETGAGSFQDAFPVTLVIVSV